MQPKSDRRGAFVLRLVLAILLAHGASAQDASVPATAETDPVYSSGDAAEDPVVWVHPHDPGASTLIVTDKQAGVLVYDLAGNELQFLPDGKLNSVDLRHHFPLLGADVALVTAGNRSDDSIAVYAVDPESRLLSDVASGPLVLGITIYGSCMYRSPVTAETYFFGNSKTGEVEQWRLFDDSSGLVDAELVRAFDVGGQVEGCVADDENAWLFIGEEAVGIWRYGAEPGAGSTRVQVDSTGAGGSLAADVEGLTLYYANGGAGYLIASSQGSSTFVVYERAPPHSAVLSFEIAENPPLGIDAVSGTDGIDVMNLGLGPAFPGGVFVAQDDFNPGGNQSFKLVPWQEIAARANPPLVVDADYDPHGVQAAPIPVLPLSAVVLIVSALALTAGRALPGRR